jgi:threonine synthase
MALGLGMMHRLGLIERMPRLVLAQAERANPLYRAVSLGKREVEPMVAGETLASAIRIGNPVSAPRAMAALSATRGVVEQASEEELCDVAARADRTGLYVCPHTAVALAATEKLARAGTIAKDDRVVVVSTANGLKFTEFKVRYHERAIDGVACRLANPPIELSADVGKVREAIAKLRRA